MYEVIQFQDTLRYGIRNKSTNVFLRRASTKKIKAYRSKARALRVRNRANKKYNSRRA